jgi:hypothetical protein
MTEIEIAQMAQLLRKMINPTLQMKLLKQRYTCDDDTIARNIHNITLFGH